jgi:protein TonB
MKTQKHHLNDKLQKSSVLFLQLGLVLALFFVYIALEFESIKKEYGEPSIVMADPEVAIITDFNFIIKRQEVKKIIKKLPKTKSTEVFITVPDKDPEFVNILTPTDIDPQPTISSQIDKLPDDTSTFNDEPQPFFLIEDAPIFPGCEDLDKEASKQCFTKEISKFVNRKFNTGLAETLNTQGKQKIWVEFMIDKTGTVTDIKARSPFKKLEKEAIRVVRKLPKMTPGRQRNKPVNVKYSLPIIFHVY